MLYKELLEILEEMSEGDLEQEVIIESEFIGETNDIEFDYKSLSIVAYEE